jgi:hypothetical protein
MPEEKKRTPAEFLAHVLTPEKKSDHICWKCKHLKWVLKGSGFPPADIIGWCKAIHWPHYWSISDMDVIKKCYAFEQIQ